MTHTELFNRTRAAFQHCFPLLPVTPEQINTFIQHQMLSDAASPATTPTCKRCASALDGPEHLGFCTDITCPYSDIMQAVDADRCFETSQVPAHWRRYAITMIARSDDDAVDIELDASPYFYQESVIHNLATEIGLLRKEAFSGGARCDHVLYFMEHLNRDAANLVAHCVHMASVSDGEHHVGFHVSFPRPEEFDALLSGLAHYQTTHEER